MEDKVKRVVIINSDSEKLSRIYEQILQKYPEAIFDIFFCADAAYKFLYKMSKYIKKHINEWLIIIDENIRVCFDNLTQKSGEDFLQSICKIIKCDSIISSIGVDDNIKYISYTNSTEIKLLSV